MGSSVHSHSISAWWRHQMETFSALLALCAGNSPATGVFSSQRPVMRSFHVFLDLTLWHEHFFLCYWPLCIGIHYNHDDAMTRTRFLRYWPLCKGNPPHKRPVMRSFGFSWRRPAVKHTVDCPAISYVITLMWLHSNVICNLGVISKMFMVYNHKLCYVKDISAYLAFAWHHVSMSSCPRGITAQYHIRFQNIQDC